MHRQPVSPRPVHTACFSRRRFLFPGEVSPRGAVCRPRAEPEGAGRLLGEARRRPHRGRAPPRAQPGPRAGATPRPLSPASGATPGRGWPCRALALGGRSSEEVRLPVCGALGGGKVGPWPLPRVDIFGTRPAPGRCLRSGEVWVLLSPCGPAGASERDLQGLGSSSDSSCNIWLKKKFTSVARIFFF